jgi:hypothetical protein
MALGGCSATPAATPSPNPAVVTTAPTTTTAAGQDETEAPPIAAKTASHELQDKLTATLTTLAATTKSPNRAQMLQAMLDAGAVKEKVELSIDVTPTGLAVDAVESATRVAEECVIGQVRDGNVAVITLPVLASGRCFVGDVN